MGNLAIVVFTLLTVTRFSFALPEHCTHYSNYHPCTCDPWTVAIVCKGIVDPAWNIKATFDEITKFDQPDFVYNFIIIQDNEELREIAADTFVKVKANHIIITGNSKLTYVSPYAFGETVNHTKVLTFAEGASTQGAESLFQMVRAFKVVEKIELGPSIDIIPYDALFESPVKYFRIFQVSMEAIESFAFYGMDNLEELTIYGDSTDYVPYLQDNAFDQRWTAVNFTFLNFGTRTNLRRFPEGVFKELLDGTVQKIQAGHTECNSNNTLEWVCQGREVYESKLVGFGCGWDTEETIWDYCDSLETQLTNN